ncbi:hypothetical protein RI543_002838 [Arxiozyma heterogenica]|uniref:isoleucine--tRNA ligase n=2 Tax=Arxiozyma heterogenica TaxID=278026 RepID=A0AAN8A6Z0_9SACH|nr:hypothetical protein RI543_002838 [Kazachstania heterogenica]
MLHHLKACRHIYRSIRWVSTDKKAHSFQHTLNLPKTTFPTRSSLDKCLKELIPQCSDTTYKKQLNQFISEIEKLRDPKEKFEFCKDKLFVLHDGPPYANGDLHLGHALNKILKDIINRYYLLEKSQYIFYKPGWDCHGLPIELKALDKLPEKMSNSLKDPIKIRSIAAKHADDTRKTQMEQFKEFAIMTDWNDPYITMSKDYEIDQLLIFKTFFNKGFIKRRNKPVYWGTVTRTALAESELEYNENHVSKAIYVKFPLTKLSTQTILKSIFDTPSQMLDKIKTIKCMIWTTTPWTLFSNRAICFNESFKYCLVHDNSANDYLIIAKDTLNTIPIDDSEWSILETFDGKHLNNLYYCNPLLENDKEYPLLPGLHVTNTTGTGLVHTAPGHGADDYLVGFKNNLEIFSAVDSYGNYDLNQFHNPQLKQFLADPLDTSKGRNVLDEETVNVIINRLFELKMLFSQSDYKHSYPYDWRSKRPVIIRSTPQWFINLTDLKDTAYDVVHKTNFIPQRGRHRLEAFIKNRNEWCISRQRVWGVPIPYFQHKDDPSIVLMNDKIISHIIQKFKIEGNTNSWFVSEEGEDIKKWLPEDYQHLASQYVKGKDTMDVWFDSGTSWCVIRNFYKNTLRLDNIPLPMSNIYLEGTDQHRGWFQSSLLTYIAANLGDMKPVAPFRTIVTHGFFLDEKGLKMSKSLGNVISPTDIIKGNQKLKLPSIGIDGLRYFVAQTDFSNDITASSVVINHVADSLKRLRLSFKFILGNLNKSDDYQVLPYDQLRPIDKYTIGKLSQLLTDCQKAYETYNFSKVLSLIQYHLNNELSAFYFDISKDTLYSDSVYSLKRKQIQTTLYHILNTYRHILTPILPVLLQEVWNHLGRGWKLNQKAKYNLDSIIGLEVPNFKNINSLRDDMETFSNTKLPILKLFKNEQQNVSKTLTKTSQLAVVLYLNDPLNKICLDVEELTDILQVTSVEIKKLDIKDLEARSGNLIKIESCNIKMEIKESPFFKCPRCWKHAAQKENELCHRCGQVVNHS